MARPAQNDLERALLTLYKELDSKSDDFRHSLLRVSKERDKVKDLLRLWGILD